MLHRLRRQTGNGKAKPDIIWEELNKLRKRRGGRLTPEAVLKEASNPSSPLHACFEWNTAKAAHEYRLIQARILLRSIQIIRGKDEPPIRAFMIVKEGTSSAYESTTELMKDAGKREQVLLRAYAELLSWRERYADLQEFAAVFGIVDNLPVPPKIKAVA